MKYSIVIHGGSSAFTNREFEELEKHYPGIKNEYFKMLDLIIETGSKMLAAGDEAEYVVCQCISMFENCELFNAGKGSARTKSGQYSHDAAIMNGQNKHYGSLTNSKCVKNPILAADAIMNVYGHKFLTADDELDGLVKEYDFEQVDNGYFRSLKKEHIDSVIKGDCKYSTVGCVVMDTYGNICAGTSTGGLRNKEDGRVGDSCCIGCGTYADNLYGGISCTGTGEYFIRDVVAYDIIAQMKYSNCSMIEAMEWKFGELEPKAGGIIGIDQDGQVHYHFTSNGLFRASLEYHNGDIIRSVGIH